MSDQKTGDDVSKKFDVTKPLNPDVLRDLPKDELIELIMTLNDRMPKSTTQLNPDEVVEVAPELAAAADVPEAKEYERLPASLEDPGKHVWRFDLVNSGEGNKSVSIEIHDDIVLGRATPGFEPDVDLDLFNAGNLGVSRRHAMMRPSNTHLLVIDLKSTNGTFINGRRVVPGTARPVVVDDSISFGLLHFVVRNLSAVR